MSDDVLEESEFEWLANLYNINGAINHPSELHGIMVGHIAGNTMLQDDEWLGLCLDHMGIEEFNVEKQPQVHADLCRFYQDTLKGIGEDSSAFQICLPDDSYVVAERAEALGAWVGGFLEGIAVTQTQALANLDEDLQEILRDLVEISQLDSRMASSETSERDFFEVCEYVRIGVLNLYVEFHEPDAGASEENAAPTIH